MQTKAADSWNGRPTAATHSRPSPAAGTLQRRSSVASLRNSRTRVARAAASRVPGITVLSVLAVLARVVQHDRGNGRFAFLNPLWET